MAGYSVTKEMSHPDGSRVFLAYSTEDESALLKEFARYRNDHDEANRAAVEGKEIKVAVVAAPAPPTKGA